MNHTIKTLKLNNYFLIIIIAIIMIIYSRIYFHGWALAQLIPTLFAGISGILFIIVLFLPEFIVFSLVDLKWQIQRKRVGIIAYAFAVGYTLTVMFLNPHKYVYGFLPNFFSYDLLLGSTAMCIFTVTTALSNSWWINKLGYQRWKKIITMNYGAYFLLLLRGWVLDVKLWQMFLLHPQLISPRMFLTFTGSLLMVKKFLYKELKPDQVVILDNANSHKSNQVKD